MNNKIIGYFVIMLMITATTLPAIAISAPTESDLVKNSPTNFFLNFFYWLFERFPNAFPTLKYILVTNGIFNGLVEEGTGTLVMKLTDDPPDLNITEALVNISQVSVHYAGTNDTNGTWITVVNGTQTFDLIPLLDATVFL